MKDKLKRVDVVIAKHPELHAECKIGSLAVKLAREAIFGDEILKQCTPRGRPGILALPQVELNLLKQILFKRFPQYGSCPENFEKNGRLLKMLLAKRVKD